MSLRQKQKHVMLSYEWQTQELVTLVYDYLVQKQLPIWMDIKAGIPSENLYEGIAEAVENSSCFVCFMTPEYQQSDFCKQELQYAKQRKIPIIPLKLQKNWDPTGWLGFITAGLLWMDFYHIRNFENKAAQLYSRICSAVHEQISVQDSVHASSVDKTRAIRSQSAARSSIRLPNRRIENNQSTPKNSSPPTSQRQRRPLSRRPKSSIYIKTPRSVERTNPEEEDDAKMRIGLSVIRRPHRADD